MPGRSTQYDGFDPDQFAQARSDIDDVKDRLGKLEESLGSEDAIARTFEYIYPRVTKFQDIYEICFTKMLDRDGEAKTKLAKFINTTDRNKVNEMIGKFGYIAWSILIALISGGIGYFLKS